MRQSQIARLSTSFVLMLLVTGAIVAQTNAPAATNAPAKGPGDVVAGLYDLVGAEPGRTPDWDKVRALFVKEAVIVLRTARTATTLFSLEGFIQDFVDFYKKPFHRGTLTIYPNQAGFTEKVVRMKTFEFWDMANVLVLYEAHITGDPTPPQRGIDSWLLSRRDGRWVIVAITNDLITKDHPVPPELAGDK
ncbi:MAG TPA: hypothetical protein VEG35_06300 [Burkholderiales bacterium]|nr:hypothetical protein [Burkholderiales bacterium]